MFQCRLIGEKRATNIMHTYAHTLNMRWDRSNQLFEHAASVREQLRISIKLGRQWQEYQSRFTGPLSMGKFLAVQNPFPENHPPIVGHMLGCSFRMERCKYMFASAVLPSDLGIDADQLAIAWPNSVQQMERRCFARAAIDSDMRIPAKIWPAAIALTCPCPNDPPLAEAKLLDISAGGALISLPQDSIAFDLDAALLIEIVLPEPFQSVYLEACVRRRADLTDTQRVLYGLQFIGLQHTTIGCQTLEQLARFTMHMQGLAHAAASMTV